MSFPDLSCEKKKKKKPKDCLYHHFTTYSALFTQMYTFIEISNAEAT